MFANAMNPDCTCCGPYAVPHCSVIVRTPGPCGAIPSGDPFSFTSKTAYIQYTITDTATSLVVASGTNWSPVGGGHSYGPESATFSLPSGSYRIDATFQGLATILIQASSPVTYDGFFANMARFVASWTMTFDLVCPGSPVGISIPTTPTSFQEFFNFQLEHPAGSPFSGDMEIVTDSEDGSEDGSYDPALNNNHQFSLSGTITGGSAPSHTLDIRSSNDGVHYFTGTVTVPLSYCDFNDPSFRTTYIVVLS
jgi:hypothetical protein